MYAFVRFICAWGLKVELVVLPANIAVNSSACTAR